MEDTGEPLSSLQLSSIGYAIASTVYYWGYVGSSNDTIYAYNIRSARASTALTQLGGLWYPLDIIPLYEIELANMTLKAEDLQCETNDYKILKKTVHFTGIEKGSGYPTDYPLPSNFSFDCLVLYTKKFTIQNGYYTPTDSSAYIDTGKTRRQPKHNFKYNFKCSDAFTTQLSKAEMLSEYEFKNPPNIGSYDFLPVSTHLKYNIDTIINRNLTGNIDNTNIALPTLSFSLAVTKQDSSLPYPYTYSMSETIGLHNTVPQGAGRVLIFDSNDLTAPGNGRPNIQYMQVYSDDFLLLPDMGMSSDAHTLTRGSTIFNTSLTTKRPAVKATDTGDNIQNTSGEWVEIFTY